MFFFVKPDKPDAHARALGTLSDRLAILLSTSHVVGVNEISPQQLDGVKPLLSEHIASQTFGFHDAVLWHPLHVWGCGCGVD